MYIVSGVTAFVPCFNRYMVECELVIGFSNFSNGTCFNRYMVECECKSKLSTSAWHSCFNRYMVECEFVSIERVIAAGAEF